MSKNIIDIKKKVATIVLLSIAIIVISIIIFDYQQKKFVFDGEQHAFAINPKPICEDGHIILYIKNTGYYQLEKFHITAFTINEKDLSHLLEFPPLEPGERTLFLDYNCENGCNGLYKISVGTISSVYHEEVECL